MNKTFKKTLSIILTILMLVTSVPFAFAADTVASGTCGADGSNVWWELDSDGVLTFSGTGAIEDYHGPSFSPIYYYRNDVKKIVVNDGVTHLGTYICFMFSEVTEVSLPESLISIGENVFAYFESLESIELPDNLTTIGIGAFQGCAFKSVIIPVGVTTIDISVFQNCQALETVTLPEGLTTICDNAFYFCESLKSISIPESVTTIGENAFELCSSLESVYVPCSWDNNPLYSGFGSALIIAGHSIEDGVCNACGCACPHENVTDGKCDACGVEGTVITITMTDSYGDGWNGNAIVIEQLVDGAYTEVVTATFEDGASETFTTFLQKDGIYAFSWVEGDYPDECSFTVAVDGETVYEFTDGSTLTNGEIFYTNCEHTSYTDGKCIACGYECSHESSTDGKCSACGYECPHEGYTDGKCSACGYECPHESYTDGKCSVCGCACPHENVTDGKCDACGVEGRFVTITMQDSYGDSWNGNTIVIKQLVDGAYTEFTTATVDDGYSYTFTAVLQKDSIYAFSWVQGDYADECSFTVAVDGETVYEATDGNMLAEGKVFYVNCEHNFTESICSGCKLECGVDFEHKVTDYTCTLCGKYIYAITHQPTEAEPYVELNKDTDASYQWYSFKKEYIELTDESSITSGGSYSDEKGWTVSEPTDSFDTYLTVSLKEGETIRLAFDQYVGYIYIIPEWGWNGSEFKNWINGTEGSFTAYEDSVYSIKLHEENAVRAFMNTGIYTKLDGETAAELATPVVGNIYACEVTFADGAKEISEFVKFPYRIIHQPTEAEPYVELNDDTDASYQWYTFETKETEITDENAQSVEGYASATNSSYNEETGWTGVYAGSEFTNERTFFSIDLKKGDKVIVEFSGALTRDVYLYAGNSNSYSVDVEEGKTVYELMAEGDDKYELIAWLADEEVTVKAYVVREVYNSVDGQTSATLIPTALGNYVCEVTFADGTTEMSDTFEVTKLHDCDFTGEWKYDADKHWKECTFDGCDKTAEEADHSFTDGKCTCDYACPHGSYTDGVCDNCGTECTHESYTYGVCDNCGTECQHESYTEGVCDNCDYECPHEKYTMGICDECNYLCPHSFTEFNEILAPKCEESGLEESYCDYCNIRLEQQILATDHKWTRNNLVRPTQNTDGTWTDGYYYDKCENDEAHNVVTEVAKRADYTAYDEAYKALRSAHGSEALTAEGAAAVNQSVMSGMMMPQNLIEGESSTAYLNNWVKNAQSIIAKLESGEYVKADYTEIDEVISAVDEALEDATISTEMEAELADIKAQLEVLKADANTSKADLANIGLLDRAEAITEVMNNCANGKHSFTKYEETEAPKCGKAGKEVASCDNGCGATDEKEIPALEHIDNNGDYFCDYGCGTQISDGVEGETGSPADDCDHLCHKDGILGFFWKIISFFFRLFNIQQYCDCGQLHYDAPFFG